MNGPHFQGKDMNRQNIGSLRAIDWKIKITFVIFLSDLKKWQVEKFFYFLYLACESY